jgi:uncharacterized protein YqgV (UPF0045/DUF77 family)
MKISVDISMYPLQSEFEKPILAFIEALAQERTVDIARTELSTQIYGEYETIMPLLHREIKAVFEEIPQSVFVIKLVGEDRKGRL